jgi:fatty acid desaturase
MCIPAENQARNGKKEILQKGDEWIEQFDLAAFTEDIRKLGEVLEKNQGDADVAHLKKIVRWSNTCLLVGFLTMGFRVNLLSALALSTWTFSRWTMIAHHTCHGGYDKCHPNKNRWNRFKFGVGSLWRRTMDWMDWMMPEAWNVEHNNRHHYNLSELEDPDLVENNLKELRDMKAPLLFKYIYVFIAASTWKWLYYSPNTYKELKLAKWRREGKKIPDGVIPSDAVTIKTLLTTTNPFYTLTEFITVVVGPYILFHFFVLPLPLLFVGQYIGQEDMYTTSIKNLLLAEFFTNLHGFVAIVTNHAGDDMYRFREGCRPYTGSFYLRQVLASVDFAYGTDIVDFLHGWLNYQIEHHLWPNLSMLSYQKSGPLVREICEKHGVPYVKENVFLRVKKTVDIMVGTSSMKWFPESYEKAHLELDVTMEKARKSLKSSKAL